MSVEPPSRDAYRAAVLRCPACDEAMRREATTSAEVEVCDACEGLWIGWFDGEVHTLAIEAETARLDHGTPPPSRPNEPSSGSRTCPQCSRPLALELYRFADARDDDLITGVEVLRCADCAGAFVPRGSAHLLLDRVREGRPAGLWEALRALLQRLWNRP